MQRSDKPLLLLLKRGQQYVVLATSLAYLAYALLTALISRPGPFPSAFQTPKYWAALVALATVLAVVSAPAHLQRIYLLSSLGFLVVTALEVPRTLGTEAVSMNLPLWLTLNILVSFVVFGSRRGTYVNAVTIGVPLTMLLTQGPLRAAQLADWLTASIVMVGTGLIAHTLMTFIENNLLVHAQDSERLRAARQDALTDVYGRGATEEELDRAIEHARKTNAPLSVIVTDIDHFKVVNDRYGHAAGDDVLRAVAKRLRRNVGGIGGLVGRWGGEEFIVLLPGVAKPDALALAERLRREVSDQPLAGLDITASFGVASYRGAGDTPDQLFGRADLAMYEAKRSGRNAVR